MSNRNRDDREHDERQHAQHERQQAYSQQQGRYGRPRGNEADDRDVQGNFSSGAHGNRGYGQSQAPMGGLGGQESPGYGMHGYESQGAQGYGPRSYGAPSTGAGSQGFGPEGYGTSPYEGRGGYESQPFGSQGPDPRYGSHGREEGRDIRSSGVGAQRHLQGESFGRESGGRQSRPMGGQWHNPNDEQRPFGYGQSSYGQGSGQSLPSQQDRHGQQGRQGFESGLGMRSSHRGLGPKNYTRSDERIREDLNERLTDADDIDARGLTVEVSNGVATLTGTVEQRWMKHRAEDLAESCSGVRDVNNQIRVQSLHQESGIGGQGSSKSGGSLGAGTSGSPSGASPGAGATATPTPSGSSSSNVASGSPSSGSSSTRPGGSTGSGH